MVPSLRRLVWPMYAFALVVSSPSEAQNQHDMTFHTIPQCNVVDTRVAGGPFTSGETRTYNVVGSGSLAAQGGSSTGCGIPGFSNGIAQVQAVALVITAISPTGTSHIALYAADQSLAKGVLTFNAGDLITNTSQVAVAQAAGVGDIKVFLNFYSSHVLIQAVGYYSKPVQTVHVHPVPGDHTASGTALLNALAAINNASATKRYLLKLEPGIYDLGSTELVMKPYVDIEGSGQQTTVIQGTGNADPGVTAVVEGAASSELRNLQVKSTGSPTLPISIAILVPDGADTRIVDVTAVSGGGNSNWAIRNTANAVVERSTLKTEGGSTFAYGISSKGPDAAAIVKHTVIEVTNGTGTSYGMYANTGGSYKEIRDVQVKVSVASGSAYGYGQFVFEGGEGEGTVTPQAARFTNCTIEVSGSTVLGVGVRFIGTQLNIEQSQIRAPDVGVETSSTGTTIIEHSEISEAATDTVISNTFNARIGASRLDGGSAIGAICAGVYDETFTFFSGPSCP